MFPELLSALGAQTELWSPQPGATVQRAFLRTEGELPTTRPEKDTLETMLCIDGQVDIVRRVRRFLLDHMDSRLTIERLAEEFRISPTYLKETFRRVSGQPIHRYLQDCRLTRAARLLSTTNDSVLSIAVSVGYSGTSRFNAAFKERYGVSPRQFRQNAVK